MGLPGIPGKTGSGTELPRRKTCWEPAVFPAASSELTA
jgi:hypothetical protein